MIFTNLIQGNLQTKFLGRHIEYFPFTDSTNEDIWELVLDNEAKNGSLVITDNQRKGKGRRENQWFSSPGKNLTFSFLLISELPIERIGKIPLLIGIAICESLTEVYNLNCKLKWPNDILLNNKKIGGILIESKVIEDKYHLCVGIGINVNADISLFPIELKNTSTALISELGKPIQREPLLATILNKFENYLSNRFYPINENWLKYCAHKNSIVNFHYGEKDISGKFIGINESGFAQIEIEDEIETFPGGELIL